MNRLQLGAAISSIFISFVIASCETKPPETTPRPTIRPPFARAQYAADTVFGVPLVDNYRWLEKRDSPSVIAYLTLENSYADRMTRHTEALRETLYREILARVKQTDVSVPVRDGAYYYYTRTVEGLQYPIHCRVDTTAGAIEQVLLDQNEMAAGRDHFNVASQSVSPNDKILAYAVDTTGREVFTIQFRDLETGETLPDALPNADYDLAWSADSRHFYYVTQDDALRPYKVFRHELGTTIESDQELFHESNARFYIGAGLSKDHKYVMLGIHSKMTTEYRYLPANDSDAEFQILATRREGVEYSAEHAGDQFFIMTNDDAINFRIVAAPDSAPGPENWRDIVPHQSDALIEEFDVSRDFISVKELRNAVRRVRIQSISDTTHHYIEFDEPIYTASLGDNREYDTDSLRIEYTSNVTPKIVYDYSLTEQKLVQRKREEVGGGYDPDAYESSLLMVPVRDGVEVPITIVRRKDIDPRGDNPLVLWGYGAYGYTREAYFSAVRPSLLDRGVVFAAVHVRGSTARGRQWYLDGKFLEKKNTFNDFIDCAEYLIEQDYTSPDRLVAVGGSAGGLLMGAVVNERPDLFEGVVMQVPFVDLMNTMLDETIPLTVPEYEEWGNPNEEEYFRYMYTYSPYDNMTAQVYPHMLVTAGLNDPRVQYWEPAKWVAKLRNISTGNNTLLLRTDMGAGHLGAAGRYDYLKDAASTYVFVLDVLGYTE
jgi:oligopeptidase B